LRTPNDTLRLIRPPRSTPQAVGRLHSTRALIERTRWRTISGGVGASLVVLFSLSLLASPASALPPGHVVPCGDVCSVGGGGEPFDFALARYNANGSLDASFGSRGSVTMNMDAGSPVDHRARATSVAVQPDRKIVVAGDALGGSFDGFALARYSPDGTPDPSFGDGGQVITNLGRHHDARALAALRQPNGKMVVAGSAGSDFALVRYQPDGSLDTSFGRAGIVRTDFGGEAGANALALQSDGEIIAAGHAGSSTALARYEPDGSLDASFGTGGKVVIHDRATVSGVLVQPNGRIVSVERSCRRGYIGFRLSRFTRDGSLDSTFGHGGTAGARVGRDSCTEGAAFGPDGKVLVAGESGGRRRSRDVALLRFNPNGTLNRSFGHDGKVVVRRPGSDRAKAVLVQRDGKIIVAGTAWGRSSRLAGIAISRYNANGSLDRSFGHRAQSISKGGQATAAALAGNGRIIVAANPQPPGHDLSQGGLAFARLHGGRASSPRGVASAAHKRHVRHRRRAPHPVPAWFINAHNFEELKRFAATDACAFARAQPRGAHRTLILDFGGARAYRGGGYGAAVNHGSLHATNTQIRIALKVAADAYASCHRRGQVRIVYANTNHFKSKRSAHRARRIGVQQARTMRHLRAYQRRRGYGPAESAGVAGDIEMAYWGPEHSKAMVNGAKSVWRHGYVDFGTAGGCPPHPKGVHVRGCFNGWSLSDVASVSNARGGHPLPEVYYRGGPRHFDQAAEWANVARAWNAEHASRYRFFGATGSAEFSSLSPRQSWKLLRAKVPGRVRRELLNFKQDRRRIAVASRGRGDDASRP
jgi:uncharacterized delta-60 repeat protein